ncbi:hypothetical protein NW765_015266 [Fusarium oxysporum]|nr:hypothetical protein NW765_015266 [Fusarium oxysporum]
MALMTMRNSRDASQGSRNDKRRSGSTRGLQQPIIIGWDEKTNKKHGEAVEEKDPQKDAFGGLRDDLTRILRLCCC